MQMCELRSDWAEQGGGRERGRQAAPAAAYQVERVARGEGGVDVAEGSGEAQNFQLRRPQCHEDGHRVICSVEQWLG